MKLLQLATILFPLGTLTHPHAGLCQDIEAILPLPEWAPSQDGIAPARNGTPFLLGGSLLPQSFPHDDNESGNLSPMTSQPTIATEFQSARPDGDLSLFLPDALLGKAIHIAPPSSPTAAHLIRKLDDDFLTSCRGSPGDAHLIDPDSHVSETQKEDLLRFLQFHARDARIKAFVIVTDRDQTVPNNADLSNVASGALRSHDSCLAIYPLGEPWRARLFVSGSVHRIIPPEYLNGVVKDCAKDAELVSDPMEQLHRFTVRLSIRLFWLEKLISTNTPALTSVNGQEVPSEIVSKRQPALDEALLNHVILTPSSPHQWWSVTLGVALSLAGGGATYAALRYRRRRLISFVWIMPETEIPPRLGGAFSGGGGAWIQYR